MDLKFDRRDPPRVFEVGKERSIRISDHGQLRLDANEQITFVTEGGAEYDVARKDWGFYATPSLNGRLVDHKLHAALVRNAAHRYYVFLMEEGKRDAFERYLRDEEQTLVAWLDDTVGLRALDPTIRAPDVRARIETDKWLSDVLRRPTFRVSHLDAGAQEGQPLAAHALAHPGAFYYAKVPTSNVAAARDLARVGMYTVDVNVTLDWDARASRREPVTSGDVHAMRPEESAEVVAIAGRAFEHSRFHLDPAFTPEEAHRVKREWIANYARGGRGDRLFVASAHGRPVGFLAALVTRVHDKPAAVIDLIAVDESARGAGHGRALVDAFVDHYRATHEVLRVGTQAVNHGSLALYQRAGFAISETQYVLHMHAGGGAP